MAGVQGGWVLRPFTGAAEHGPVEALWLAALQGRWPLLPRAVAMVRDGFFAVGGGRGRLRGGGPGREHPAGALSRPGTSVARSAPACSAPRWTGCAPAHGPRGRRRHGLHLAGRAADLPAAATSQPRTGADQPDNRRPPRPPAGVTNAPARPTTWLPWWPARPPRSRTWPAGSRPGTGTSCSPATARGRSSPPCCSTARRGLRLRAGRHHQLRRGRAPAWKDAAWAAPWWHARRRYCATAVPAPATSAGPSASRSTPARIRPGFCLRALPVEGGRVAAVGGPVRLACQERAARPAGGDSAVLGEGERQ